MLNPELTHKAWFQICQIYNIPTDAEIVPLNSDENRTYQISIHGRDRQVLRLYQRHCRTNQAIDAELSILRNLSRFSDLKIPTPIAGKHGQYLATIYENNEPQPTRVAMFSFVTGKVLSRIKPSSEMMFRLGQSLGQLDLALHRAEEAINPSATQFRDRRDGAEIVDWSLGNLTYHRLDYDFLYDDKHGKRLHPTILEIADHLRVNYRKLKGFLPHQLLHLDANFSNLVFDGTKVGILDFDNMGYGARIEELVAPLHSIYEYELKESCDRSIKYSTLSLLKHALVSGYRVHVKLTDLELESLSLFQAIKMFGALGWIVSRKGQDRRKRQLKQNGEARVKRILALLEKHERRFSFSRFDRFRLNLKKVKNALKDRTKAKVKKLQ